MMEDFVDDMLVETLMFLAKKVKRGGCTHEQKLAALNAMDSVANIEGTIDELADFYGKSKDAVNSVIKRRYIGKPRRNVVLYSFSKFRQIVPPSWHIGGDKSST